MPEFETDSLKKAKSYKKSSHAIEIGGRFEAVRIKFREAAEEITKIFTDQAETWREIHDLCEQAIPCIKNNPRLLEKCKLASIDGYWPLDGMMLGFGPVVCYYDMKNGKLYSDTKSALAEPMRIIAIAYALEETNAEKIINAIRHHMHKVKGRNISTRKSKPVSATVAPRVRQKKAKPINKAQ